MGFTPHWRFDKSLTRPIEAPWMKASTEGVRGLVVVHLLGKVQEQDRMLTYAPLESREFCSPKSTEMLKEWIREQEYNDCDVVKTRWPTCPLNHPKPNSSGRFWGAVHNSLHNPQRQQRTRYTTNVLKDFSFRVYLDSPPGAQQWLDHNRTAVQRSNVISFLCISP